MNSNTQRGFLILADITGFTPFVADTELDHSNDILNEILKGIVSYLTPTFTLAEVEGDAVFVYAPVERFPRGDLIIEIIEASYYAFRDRKSTLQRLRTCNCKACEMAPLLDLKFIVHYGEYIMNNVSGKKKPLGTSVNVAHRLLKNSINEQTGWKAYMLFTKDFVNETGMNATNFYRQTERYDHIGPVETFSIDLDELYKNALEQRRVYLSKEDADVVVERAFPVLLLCYGNGSPIRGKERDGAWHLAGTLDSGPSVDSAKGRPTIVFTVRSLKPSWIIVHSITTLRP